ncbi:46 kDa FK506-binding nuclear protein-like [Polistes fuscatus]|uniref:46 kDa FK506-binding nuclear protein-like n=1 Tax=Polistes fuscatus TaxID=30207 RepID=UPI001CA99817|nr:46 kDa FK506-binding nuclear protein-like [Polistes fuscatus]
MFWGLILQPNKKYILDVDMSFHISMAVLHSVIDDYQTVNVMTSLEDDSNNEDEDEDCNDEDDDYDKLKSSKKTTDDFENKAKRVKGDNSFEYNPRKKLKKSKDTVVETKKQDIKKGTGAIAKEGKIVSVYYVGRLKNGVQYIEERSGKGFQFTVGKDEVVEGLNMGVEGMRVGGKRRIFVPPSLGYGKKGFFPSVPPNSNIIFEVELKYVR